jgi:hypothetical protein
MANQDKSQQAKKVEAMGKKSGATKDQVAQGLARAGGKSSYNVTNKDVKRAGQAAKIIAGAVATAVGPGKIVKGVQAATKVAKVAKAASIESKALKAAKGPSLAKVEKKALKAANKPVKSKDADIMNRNNPYARQAVLNEKPANPKVVRGGSMKSKINWPDSMTKGK